MADLGSIAMTMDKEHTDRVLSPRAALLVCAGAAVLGWIGVAGAVFVGKAVVAGWRDMDVAGDAASKIAPAAGGNQAPSTPKR